MEGENSKKEFWAISRVLSFLQDECDYMSIPTSLQCVNQCHYPIYSIHFNIHKMYISSSYYDPGVIQPHFSSTLMSISIEFLHSFMLVRRSELQIDGPMLNIAQFTCLSLPQLPIIYYSYFFFLFFSPLLLQFCVYQIMGLWAGNDREKNWKSRVSRTASGNGQYSKYFPHFGQSIPCWF